MATLQELQARRQAYVDAELRILQSQEYVVGDGSTARRNRRADLEQVRLAISELDAEISRLQAATSGRRLMYIR